MLSSAAAARIRAPHVVDVTHESAAATEAWDSRRVLAGAFEAAREGEGDGVATVRAQRAWMTFLRAWRGARAVVLPDSGPQAVALAFHSRC